MRLGTILAGIASLTLASAPAFAANPAASLSVAPASARASAAPGGSNLAAPGSVIGLVLFAAIVAGGIWLAVDGDDGPDSP